MELRHYSLKITLLKLRYLFSVLLVLFTYSNSIAQQRDIIVRISEIEIYPEHLEAYQDILKEEARASLKLEPGVLAIFPLYQKDDASKIRILEMYANKEAYQSHLKTPHFQKYKTTTSKMVKSLKLVDMNAIDSEAISVMFRKVSL
ncbi:putative quinol monooxygenase [Pedobacter sp. WC2423]|uniref:putative quinol monooxygenase n=1 Tax=Pedobacter sp. WC2423 TaxID=3234142 RepID=UPI003465D753